MSTVLLAAKLLELRKNNGISQKEIADYLGITREAYSHYERNTREPGLETILKLTKLYKIEVSELINENTILTSSREKNELSINITKQFSNTIDNRSDSLAVNTISDNIQHFLKLFTGKNSKLNLTDITKDDISFLAQYKKLNMQNQSEIRQFVKFKSHMNQKE